jgi:microcystin-dependent protein
MANPYLGEIRIFGFGFAPEGWLTCNGQLLPITQYSALFSLLGTTYGGNGTTTFGLPNLQSRFPIHQGQGPGLSNYVLGEEAGVESVTLLYNQMPVHTHVVNATTADGNASSPAGAYLATPVASPRGTTVSPYTTATGSPATLNPNTIANAGGNQPVSILPPLLCVNFCICVAGLFPTRGE